MGTNTVTPELNQGSGPSPPSTVAPGHAEKRWVAGVSIVWALLITVLKITVGLWTNSLGILSEALHFSSDVWSSLVVMFGLLLVWAGRRYGQPDLVVADPLAAVAVSGIVASICVRLGRRTLDALVDAAPVGMRARLYDEVRAVQRVFGSGP